MPRIKAFQKQRREALEAARAGLDQYVAQKAAAAAEVEKRREEHARTRYVTKKPLDATDFAYTQCECRGCAADGAGEDGNITKELLKHEPLNLKAGKIRELALHGIELASSTAAKIVKAEMDKLVVKGAFFLTPAELRAAAPAEAAARVPTGARKRSPSEPVVALAAAMATMMDVDEDVSEVQSSFFAGGEGAASAAAGGEEEAAQPPRARAGYGASGTGNSPVKKKKRLSSVRVSTGPGPFLAANRTVRRRRRHPPLLLPAVTAAGITTTSAAAGVACSRPPTHPPAHLWPPTH